MYQVIRCRKVQVLFLGMTVMTTMLWLASVSAAFSEVIMQAGGYEQGESNSRIMTQNSLRPSAPRIGEPIPTDAQTLFAKKFRQLIDLQRQMVRGLGRHMADIKAGGGTGALLVAIWFAFLYGAVHAVGPGHGKMVVV